MPTNQEIYDSFAFLGEGLFERACSSQEVNNFIRDELQPNKEFHRLYNDAIDSLYEELQRVSPNTFYGIHNLIEVSGETAPNSKGAGVVEKEAEVIVSL